MSRIAIGYVKRLLQDYNEMKRRRLRRRGLGSATLRFRRGSMAAERSRSFHDRSKLKTKIMIISLITGAEAVLRQSTNARLFCEMRVECSENNQNQRFGVF